MMLPKLNKNDVMHIIEDCTYVGEPVKGGQKIVFPCVVNGTACVVKFILLPQKDGLDEAQSSQIDSIYERAIREISIMSKIDSPYIVKLMSPEPKQIEFDGQHLLVYTEEQIQGESLDKIIQRCKLNNEECLKLCECIAIAISELWKINVVHRDIKPQNIIRNTKGDYILLDMGVAFDLNDKSLTQYGMIPGTLPYFSPEQIDFQHKRDLDFRSDLFSLGIVAYQAITQVHPFYQIGMTNSEIFNNIINKKIDDPRLLNVEITEQISAIICRLLSKHPNSRYRKCDLLLSQLYEARRGI